jgi:WD40 repeat protein
MGLSYSPDGRGLFSLSGDGTTLRRWDGPQVIKSLPCPTPFLRTTIAFSPGSQSLYALADTNNSEVQVFDANTLNLKRSFKLSGPCGQLFQVSPDERWLVGQGAMLNDICVWDVASGKPIAHLTGVPNKPKIPFSPDSRVLAFSTGKWEVKLWDIVTRQLLRTLEPHPWVVYAICFSPDSRYIASSSWAGDIRVSEVATGKEAVSTLYGHGSGVCSLSFSPDGATLVSSGDDYSVRFWNVTTGREMIKIENGNNRDAQIPFLSPTGELLVYQDFTQNLRVRVTAIPTLAEIEKAHEAESKVP